MTELERQRKLPASIGGLTTTSYSDTIVTEELKRARREGFTFPSMLPGGSNEGRQFKRPGGQLEGSGTVQLRSRGVSWRALRAAGRRRRRRLSIVYHGHIGGS